jgi:hypothetical protein
MQSPPRGTGAVLRLLAGYLCLAGCFNSAGPSPDAGGPVTCNDLLPPSDALVEVTSAGSSDLPPATGGELAAGLYHLVSSLYYPAPSCAVALLSTHLKVMPSSSPPPAREGTIEIVTATSAGDSLSESVRYIVSDSALTIRIGCISPNTGGLAGSGARIPFNATASEIQLYQSTPGCGASIDTYRLDGP